jgi:hypothetical protein
MGNLNRYPDDLKEWKDEWLTTEAGHHAFMARVGRDPEERAASAARVKELNAEIARRYPDRDALIEEIIRRHLERTSETDASIANLRRWWQDQPTADLQAALE